MLIQKLRLQRGWSQEQLATISGLSTRTIQRLERGQPASLETVINLLTNPGYFWVIWPALGWGIALASHALKTFELIPFLNADWEKKQVENHLGRKL